MSLLNPVYDPTYQTGLLSLDFGSVQSPDGRDHPVTAMSPAYRLSPTEVETLSKQARLTASSAGVDASAAGVPSISALVPHLPAHFGARLAVSVVAVGLILIVAWRLAR